MAASLCAATAVSAADGLHFTGGDFNHVPGGTIITTTTDSDPGLLAENTGTIISADDSVAIKTTGINSYGAFANEKGTILIGSSADIATTGSDTHGAYADNNSIIKIGGYAAIATSGDKAHGAYAWNSSMDIGDYATIDTTGRDAHGIVAYGIANMEIGGHAAITTSGDYAHGVHAWSKGNIDLGSYATIVTSGESADGIRSFANSRLDIGDHANITTSGDKARGAFVSDNSSMDIGDRATITTAGYQAHGAYAWNSTSMDIGDYATITTTGNEAYGIYARIRSDLNIGDYAAIATSGDNAYGAYAQQNSRIDIGGQAMIITSGDYARGAFSFDGSYIDIGGQATIITSGDYARGVQASTSSSMDIGDHVTIITSGDYARGAQASTSSSMDIGDHVTITTSGDNAHGTHAAVSSYIDIGDYANITTTGERAHAVLAEDNSSILLRNAAISASGPDAYAVHALSNSQVTGSGVFDITGNMSAGAYGSIDMTLENGSLFTGATESISVDASSELTMTLNGVNSEWDVTGSSELTNLYMNGSAVDMTYAALGAEIFMISLGQSASDNGVFRMNADIADEFADHIYVGGVAQGTYRIDVVNDGSQAALGTEMTDLVFVEQGQPVVFILDHIVEKGGFQYELRRPDQDTGAGPLTPRANHESNAWYLSGNGRASVPGSGAINSFAGSYLMAYADTQTLIQRMGDLRQSPYGQGLWFRLHGGKFESNSKSYVRGFDMDYGGIQIGYDRKLENKWGGDLYTGVMFGYSKGDLDYSHDGSGEVDSKTLGVYGTYIARNGWYVDTILKYQWMTNDFDVIDTAGTLVRGQDVDTGGIGASVEIGKRIHVGDGKENKQGWYVEPQIQLSYQRQDGGYFNATNGLRIGVDSFDSLLGRIGVLIGYETEKTNLYAKVSKVKEFDGDLTIRANGVPISESFGDNWWVYGLGCTSRISDRNSLYFEIERTSGGSFSQPWRVFAGWRTEF